MGTFYKIMTLKMWLINKRERPQPLSLIQIWMSLLCGLLCCFDDFCRGFGLYYLYHLGFVKAG